jgi:hypothetical protein
MASTSPVGPVNVGQGALRVRPGEGRQCLAVEAPGPPHPPIRRRSGECMGDLDAGRVAADGATWLVHEIAAGEYIRQITLPRAVDADKARTTFDNGVLTLTLPKSEDAKPRKSTRPGEGSVDRTTC